MPEKGEIIQLQGGLSKKPRSSFKLLNRIKMIERAQNLSIKSERKLFVTSTTKFTSPTTDGNRMPVAFGV